MNHVMESAENCNFKKEAQCNTILRRPFVTIECHVVSHNWENIIIIKSERGGRALGRGRGKKEAFDVILFNL